MTTLTAATVATFDLEYDLAYIGQLWIRPLTADDWLVSGWNSGVSSATIWSTGMVGMASDGAVELSLGAAPAGSSSVALGSHVASGATATTGTFSWTAEVPEMVDGAVFGMFARQEGTYDRLLEFDFEFVGADTTQVQVTVHMEDAQGRHIRNLDRTLIDLGFDAAAGIHTYDVVLTGTGAVFRVDGETVAYFSGADMPGGVWYTGDLQSNLNLWAGDQRHTSWAGAYTPTATPITARVTAADIRAGDLSGDMPLLGGSGNDSLTGTSGHDVMDGLAGNDTLWGGDGNDRMLGGFGDDRLHLDAGNDWINGGSGSDWLVASGSAPTTVNLARMIAQDTGYGFDQIRGIEHVLGGSGADTLTGSTEANIFDGMAGNDTLTGGAGADVLYGRSENDILSGGTEDDALYGGDGVDKLNGGAGADAMDGGLGNDTYTVDHAGDQVIEADGTAAGGLDSVTASVSFDLSAGFVENLTLTGSANLDGTGNELANRLTGNSGANTLWGMAGNDTLTGGAGADVLAGGLGNDRLTGGTDADRFVFSPGMGKDVVTLFEDGIDLIDLDGGLTFGQLTLSAIGGGVRATVTAEPAHWIDLLGVTLQQVDSGDFI